MILWVDDDLESSIASYIDELEEDGYDVIKASNSAEMWDQVEKNSQSISLILMDIMLPTGGDLSSSETKGGMITGLVLLEKLKSKGIIPATPVIIFTILSDQEVAEWANRNSVPQLKKQNTLPSELLEKIISMNVRRDQ